VRRGPVIREWVVPCFCVQQRHVAAAATPRRRSFHGIMVEKPVTMKSTDLDEITYRSEGKPAYPVGIGVNHLAKGG
jgi:hypothetical protein